ncbi:hypothetical protein [Nesterenkonia populi]
MERRSAPAPRTSLTAAGLSALLLLSACGEDGPAPEPEDSPEPTSEEADAAEQAEEGEGFFDGADPDGDEESEEEPDAGGAVDVAAHVQDAEWLYSPWGWEEPREVTVQDGAGTADYADGVEGAFSVGEAQTADLTGNGTEDAVVPLTVEARDLTETIWYVWLGPDDGGEPEQMKWPLAAEQSCWDEVDSVSIEDGDTIRITGTRYDGGLSIACDPTLEDASHATSRDEASGYAELNRQVELHEYDGEWYPILTSPFHAWGGTCPGSVPAHGEPMYDVAAAVAPADSAPIGLEPDPVQDDHENPYGGVPGGAQYVMGYSFYHGGMAQYLGTDHFLTPIRPEEGEGYSHQCYFMTDYPQ